VIQAELEKFPDAVRDDVVILFSAHSLPMKVRDNTTLFIHPDLNSVFSLFHASPGLYPEECAGLPPKCLLF